MVDVSFIIYYGSGAMRRNAYTARLLWQGSTGLHSNLTCTGSSPSNILRSRKLEALGYPKVKPHLSAFARFDTILKCDGWRDGQTDGRIWRSICSASKASFAASGVYHKELGEQSLDFFKVGG